MSFPSALPLDPCNGPVCPLAPYLAAERSATDPETLRLLVASCGFDAASDMICRALAQLACRQDAILRAHHACRFDQIGPEARRMAAIAGQVGLTDLARVADNAAACAQGDNPAALGAVLARLGRLCAGALADACRAG